MKTFRTNAGRLGLTLLLAAWAGAGCTGINGTGSVSPIDFLMPGSSKLLKFLDHRPPPPLVNTNALIAVAAPVQ